MHRDLAYQNSKLAAPIVLNGRSSRKAGTQENTCGSWDNLIKKTNPERMLSPHQVAKRYQEHIKANRTIFPENNDNEFKHKTRKIATQPAPEDPGNLLHILRKTGTMETAKNTSRKIFKEKLQSEDLRPQKEERKPLRPNEKTLDHWRSNIPDLSDGQYISKKTDEIGNRSPQKNGTSSQRRIDHLKSANSVLPNSNDTRRPFQDSDEKKMIQSATAPKNLKHLESTFQNEPYFKRPELRDHNMQASDCYEDSKRLHPFTKGKKTAYPEYTEKNTSNLFSPRSSDLNRNCDAKNGNQEPLDALHPGRRNIKPQQTTSTITAPPERKDSSIKATMYSYRTYSSQIF